MDSIILFYQFLIRNTRSVLPNLLTEILVRVLLLIVLVLMHLKCQPQARYITEEEMINEYKKCRKDSYISPCAMIVITICIPLVIFCTPLIATKNYIETTQAILGWTLSLLLNAILTEFLKLAVRRPRPDFFYRCFPNGLDDVEFSIGRVSDIIDGRKSFPSGHTSFAFCSLGFLSLWLKEITRGNRGTHAVCLFPLILASIIGTSRCIDNHHHWQDVIAGGVIGFVISYICYKLYCKSSDSRI
ncbi:phospholipid phosphatase 5-like [Vanessa cardui]|uniref:phospholipid phosphatase 5-like n=1 Tax=Vanessa cardui TaxID=171605 RepID=UPI001F12B333|nr:phospholipid phosphatase 5-like [Vanessa cardui]